MSSLVQIVNTDTAEGESIKRWLEPGQSVLIAPRLVMTLSLDRVETPAGEDYALRVDIRGPGVEWSAPVPASMAVDVHAMAGLHIIPRAIEYQHGRLRRVLVEFEVVGQPAVRGA
ncbi:hypothetical protein H0Z60_10105 [Ectothiorhodospiraceae bacterium WFHF3C12]|nr:hypothetical protein [Ectothiorhodospiraceae bacterium WFHF3C12]